MESMTEEEIKNLMKSDAYLNNNHPQHNETIKNVMQGWENLYPNDDRNSNPKDYYIWRTVGDNKTRAAHALRDGKVFCWKNPPTGGHPGQDYNCRCRADKYIPPLSRMHESLKTDYAYLTFNGKELNMYKNGQKIKSWEAMSGRNQYQCKEYQNIPSGGPIPEGEWLVKQKNHQNFFKDQSVIEQAISHASLGTTLFNKKIGKWPGSLIAWGTNRIWLEPAPQTNTYNRTNFSLHGGFFKGSDGCIDIPWQMDDFIDEFKRYGKDMIVKVQYPKSSCW